jgi:ABC-2 type transport system permease protein
MSELVVREIKIKYKRSVLGIVWSVLNPLLMMMVLSVVFAQLFRFDIPNYLVYYLTGSVVYGFMQEATAGALSSVFGNAGLINKVYIPKYIFPVAKTVSAFVNFFFALIALTFVAIFTGVTVSFSLFMAIPFFVVLFLFVLGLSLIFSTYAVFFRDLIHFHGIFMLMWLYITPVFYPDGILKDKAPWLLQYNPLYYFIKCFRIIVLDGAFPDAALGLTCLWVSLASFFIGLLVFKRNQDKFALYF